MTLTIHYTTQYDTVLATVTVNQLRGHDTTVGHQLMTRSMYSLLVTLGLRVPLRNLSDERWNNGLSALQKVLKQKNPHEIVLALKSLRRFYRRVIENQRTELYLEYLHTIVNVVMSRLTEDAPAYAVKPYLKTLVLLHPFLPDNSLEVVRQLESLWEGAKSVEIRYWIVRLLGAMVVKEKHHDEVKRICDRVILDTIVEMDITLSYRSMLTDLCLIFDEVHPLDARYQALVILLALWNLEDSNHSIQSAVLNLQFVRDSSPLVPGVSGTQQQLFAFAADEAVCHEYALLLSRLLCDFVAKNMPEDLAKEMSDVEMIYRIRNRFIKTIAAASFLTL